jgi:signal peptidase I
LIAVYYKLKEKLFTTNLKNPQPYQFIVFTSKVQDSINTFYMPGFKTGTHYLYRLCGLPHDVIEMKNGILFVNNKNFDEEINLKNQFKISNEDVGKIEEKDISTNEFESSIRQMDNYNIVTLERNLIKKYQSKIKLVPYILTDTSTMSGIFKWYDKNSGWTADNFGPLKIPSDCYFALGDNRHNAMDCRFTGLIKKADIKGVVLNK